MATFGVRDSEREIPFDEEKADPQKPLLCSPDFWVTELNMPAIPWCNSGYHQKWTRAAK
jgi:hypothetical protein